MIALGQTWRDREAPGGYGLLLENVTVNTYLRFESSHGHNVEVPGEP
jgi:hypothetical protein